MKYARLGLTLMGFSLLIAATSCSTDSSGLGQVDAGNGGGRTGAGSGGAGARGTGGTGTASGGNGATAGGGSGATGTGGTVGSGGGSGTGGPASGGAGTGGAGTGGRVGSGGSASGGSASGGRGGSGGVASGGVASGGNGSGGRVGTGGSATGGAATGGATTGGRSGTGGAATGGAATGGATTGGKGGGGANGTGGRGGGNQAPAPECMTADDCKLQSDCCTCAAIPVNAPPPAVCPLLCIQSRCAQLMLPQNAVACVAGRCIAGFNCDTSRISCNTDPPACPAGEVPGVNPSGACYSGGCVPASQCKTVSSCTVCGGSAPACVTYQTQMGNQHHCVTIPPVCGDNASCDCLGPSSCVAPYRSCQNYSGIRGISCSCPNC